MALSAARDTKRVGDAAVQDVVDAKMAATTTVYAGGLVAIEAGYAVPAEADNTFITLGVALKTVVNAGAAGAASVPVRRGTFAFTNSADADEITQAEMGLDCYVVNDFTVAKTDDTGARPVAGKVMGLYSGQVLVQVGIPGSGGDISAHVADNAGAHAASAISVLDDATIYTATNVETALAEVMVAANAHVADNAGAHAASAISVLDTGEKFVATNVETVLIELEARVAALE